MKGNFVADDAVRNPDRQPLEINVNAGKLLTDTLSEIELERITHPDYSPRILHIIDGVSGKIDTQLTPGGVFEITGKRLRVGGPRSNDTGLYLRAQDGTETKVEVLLRNKPKSIVGQLPDNLAAGDYRLVLRTQLGATNQIISEVRIGSSNFSLKVA